MKTNIIKPYAVAIANCIFAIAILLLIFKFPENDILSNIIVTFGWIRVGFGILFTPLLLIILICQGIVGINQPDKDFDLVMMFNLVFNMFIVAGLAGCGFFWLPVLYAYHIFVSFTIQLTVNTEEWHKYTEKEKALKRAVNG